MSAIDLSLSNCQKYSQCALLKNPSHRPSQAASLSTALAHPTQANGNDAVTTAAVLPVTEPVVTSNYIAISSRPDSEPKFFDLLIDDRSIQSTKQWQMLLTRILVSLLMFLQIGQETPGIGVNGSSAEFIIAPGSLSLCIGGVALHS
jgi:hypothetical protein